MSAREKILAAARAGLGGGSADSIQLRREAMAQLDDLASIRPALPPGSLVDAFSNRLVSPKVSASVDRIARVEEFPAAVRRYLETNRLRAAIALQPAAALKRLDWSGFELHDTLAPDEAVGVGLARWGIAETGSLVFHSSAETPILANFLPLHHVVMVLAETIVAYLEDYAAAFAATGERPPRNVNLITGASGTTDIEGSLVRGAHGPGFLHVVVAGE
jgi:L-lactate dehydrogenase complex protein LldG